MFIQRVNHRNATLSNLEALLLMYPRKRQFVRDFPKLKALLRAHFEEGIAPPSSALSAAIGIIEDCLGQLSAEEKRATADALAASSLGDIEKLAGRRIAGEKDEPGDRVFFATRLCAMALFMSGRMAGAGVLRRQEHEALLVAIERALATARDKPLATVFAGDSLRRDRT
jgi:hypothetical protein